MSPSPKRNIINNFEKNNKIYIKTKPSPYSINKLLKKSISEKTIKKKIFKNENFNKFDNSS
jgi:hypothetical protein